MRNSFDEARSAGERRSCGHPFRRCISCITRPARPPPQQVGPAAARRRRCNVGVTAGVTVVRNGGRKTGTSGQPSVRRAAAHEGAAHSVTPAARRRNGECNGNVTR